MSNRPILGEGDTKPWILEIYEIAKKMVPMDEKGYNTHAWTHHIWRMAHLAHGISRECMAAQSAAKLKEHEIKSIKTEHDMLVKKIREYEPLYYDSYKDIINR